MIPPLRFVFDVDAEPDHAFRIWTQRASMWWPPAHTTAKRRHTRLVFEPGPGGRVFERDAEGNEVDWGSVLAWEPPGRLVDRWHIFGDTTDATEVEVRFVANGDGTTRVELEHRGWDTFDGGGGGALKALAVYLGQPNSMYLDSLIGQPLFWVFAALFVIAVIRAIIPGRPDAQENLRPPDASLLTGRGHGPQEAALCEVEEPRGRSG